MLTPDQTSRLERFLEPTWIAVVVTVGAGGMPQVTPNWYVYRNGRISVSITKERVKFRNLSRDNRIAICVYSEPLAKGYASIVGHADIIDDDSIWPITRDIVVRYVRSEGVEARMRELRSENRVIVSVLPERVVFRT